VNNSVGTRDVKIKIGSFHNAVGETVSVTSPKAGQNGLVRAVGFQRVLIKANDIVSMVDLGNTTGRSLVRTSQLMVVAPTTEMLVRLGIYMSVIGSI
jgi:hypothetical protein